MSDIKKDHSIGAGTGAVGGAVVGAKAGDEVAEAVNPTYENQFKSTYQSKPYYKADRDWNDYSPAYNYAYTARQQNRSASFESVENDLERGWDKTKANSRLAWSDAREAVRDGWHAVERMMPGDADRDGR